MRILFLADTHLGFDLPFKPRVNRRRRGPDFFSNYRQALESALNDSVDCVIHGGDLLYRSRVPAELVMKALQPLKEVADQGIPVLLVPGNHERSEIPFALLTKHPRLFVFNRPHTYTLELGGMLIGLAGFPFVRDSIRKRFAALLDETSWKQHSTECMLLCVHQTFEGATVGPSGYTFRSRSDVIDLGTIPPGFQAVLSGHIHRSQILTHDLTGKAAAAPVLYPGSTERTSFAERDEQKGYLILELKQSRPCSKPGLSWTFCPLPTRPMRLVDLKAHGMDAHRLTSHLSLTFQQLPPDAVVKIRVQGLEERARPALRTSTIRRLAPETMNLSLTIVK